MTQFTLQRQDTPVSYSVNVYASGNNKYFGLYNPSVYYPEQFVAVAIDENGQSHVAYVDSEEDAIAYITNNYQ